MCSSDLRRGITEGAERSEESGEGVCERVDVPHEDGFGEGGREMRESHGHGRRLRLFKQWSQVSRLIQGPCCWWTNKNAAIWGRGPCEVLLQHKMGHVLYDCKEYLPDGCICVSHKPYLKMHIPLLHNVSICCLHLCILPAGFTR